MSTQRGRVLTVDFSAAASEALGTRGVELARLHHAAFWKLASLVNIERRDDIDDLFFAGCRWAEYWEKQFKAADRVMNGVLASDWVPEHLRSSLVRQRCVSRRDGRLLSETEADVISQYRSLSAPRRRTIRQLIVWALADEARGGDQS